MTVYEISYSNENSFSEIIFNDTTNLDFRFRIISKDGFISADLIDFKSRTKYGYNKINKNIQDLDILNDFSNNYLEKIPQYSNSFRVEICKKYKNYEKISTKLNDSIQVETFKFYKEKRKKNIKAIVTIESLINKKTNNIFPSDYVHIIKDCIDNTYNSKIINKINSTQFNDDGSKFEEQIKLIEINTINFSINVQE